SERQHVLSPISEERRNEGTHAVDRLVRILVRRQNSVADLTQRLALVLDFLDLGFAALGLSLLHFAGLILLQAVEQCVDRLDLPTRDHLLQALANCAPLDLAGNTLADQMIGAA